MTTIKSEPEGLPRNSLPSHVDTDQTTTFEGVMQSRGVTSWSWIGMKFKNMALVVEEVAYKTFCPNKEVVDKKLNEIAENRIFSMETEEGKQVHISTSELLKTLYLEDINDSNTRRPVDIIKRNEIITSIEQNKESDTISLQSSVGLGSLIQTRVTDLWFQDLRRAVVRQAVMEEIPDDERKQYIESMNFIVPTHVDYGSLLDQNEELRTTYATQLAKGSATANNWKEGTQARTNVSEADQMVREWIDLDKPLSLSGISKLNQCLTKGTTNNGSIPGTYRSPGVSIMAGGVREYLAGRHIEAEMTELCDWVNDELQKANGNQIKIVEIAARAMSWSLSIHPFSDGNGRTCRMLVNYILLKGGLPPAIIDDKRGDGAVFGSGLSQLRLDGYFKQNDPNHVALTEREKTKIIKEAGPKPGEVMENTIESMRITVELFGKK